MEQVVAQGGQVDGAAIAAQSARTEQGWDAPPSDPRALQPGLSDSDIAEWSRTRSEIRDLAKRSGWSMGEVQRRSGVTSATMSTWYAGKSRGSYPNTTSELRRFLASYSEQEDAAVMLLQEPGYVETPTARQVMQTLVYAQALAGMAIVTLGSGMGKTTVVRQMIRTRPHTWHVVMSPASRKVPAMLRAIASAVDAPTAHPGQLEVLIGERLQRNGRKTLLMVDEAQYLDDDAVNQLRKFNDVNECGIVLLGNEDAFKRWAEKKPKPGYGQLHSRFDDRLRMLKPQAGDIEAYLAAWGITDPAVVQLLTKIGHQPGALRQINKTIRIAGTIAGPQSRAISFEDVRQAWSRRSGGEML